jgi:hypothetical protein
MVNNRFSIWDFCIAAAVILLFTSDIRTQTVFLQPNHRVYDFLKRMEAKQVIKDYRDAVKPLARTEIARFLIDADSLIDRLNPVEREQLTFFKEEFYTELHLLKYEQSNPEVRWHLYQYQSSPGIFSLDVVGGYTFESLPSGGTVRTRSNGLMTYGYAGDIIGGYLFFCDNRESGKFDLEKNLQPAQGQILSRRVGKTAIEYDFVDAQFNFNIAFLTVSLEKMPNVWGAGYHGNIILSNRAPSYPQIKLRARLGKNVDFTYLHGWLYSGVIDSAESFYTPYGAGKSLYRPVYRQKYIAASMLEMSLFDGVDLAIGQSEIYGGRNPELIYMIPVMFFKAGEHYMDDLDNSQIFGSLDINVLENINFYFTLFIDELSTDDFYKDDRQRNQLGFTVGTRIFDTFYPNTDVVIEYTRLNPWVYNHKYPDATYQNHDYDLGHWLGQNGDDLWIAAHYRPMRQLLLGAEFGSYRKGGKLPNNRQYEIPTPDFLYDPVIKRQQFGITAQYEIVRDLFIDSRIFLSRYTHGPDISGVSQYVRQSADFAGKFDILIGLRYNIY